MDDERPHRPHARRRSAGADLYSIVYVSTAAREVPLNELMRLLDGARRRNAQEQVTGVLLYADKSFMQYLEGPAEGLSRVYEAIKTHPLHYGLIDLVREPIAAREFAEWSMAFHLAGAFGRSSPQAQDELLVQRLAAAARPKSLACELLSKFWQRGRLSVASALTSHSRARSRRSQFLDLDTGTGD